MGLRGVLVLVGHVLLPAIFFFAASPAEAAQAKPGCQDTCGNVSIPYPFGTTPDCYLNEDFFINCTIELKPIYGSNLQVNSISVDHGEISIDAWPAHDCYSSGLRTSSADSWLTVPKFPISHTRNKFTVVGCDASTLIQGFEAGEYATGCTAFCYRLGDVVNGSCSGEGCCQTSIPKGIWGFNLSVTSYFNHTFVDDFNPCSYAFVVEEDKFNFSTLDLAVNEFPNTLRFPVMLDWAIDNETCESQTHICKNNSMCYDSSNAPGYRCNCSQGYQGNPYLEDGCQDIDECESSNLNQCTNICSNTEGGYNCSCPKGFHGDGIKGGQGCIKNAAKQQAWIKVSVGIGIGVIVMLICTTWLFWGFNKWKSMKLKEKFFKQNGGLMLQQNLIQHEGTSETALIFAEEVLKKATNNYDDSKIVGKGGYGTVYKGTLSDGTVVAIKKSKVVDQTQIKQFINEMIILSKINHRNVVKLLGCCLETEVPLLVYEFVSNGTLFDHIHDKSKASSISWEIRLQIAAETAGVLAYLHSAASVPIIHRDVKTTNVLVDETFTAKVSDFGGSRLVPIDQVGMSTMVQGTLGYLDPEYLHTSQLTDKSDVYSFGVVLMELITGQQALSFDRSEQMRSLAMYFLTALKEDRLFEIVEDCIVNHEDEIEVAQVKEVAKIAKRCIVVRGEERPSMKEVAMELEGLRMMVKHPWVNNGELSHGEETENLLGSVAVHTWDNASDSSCGYDSMRNHMTLHTSDAR